MQKQAAKLGNLGVIDMVAISLVRIPRCTIWLYPSKRIWRCKALQSNAACAVVGL